MKADCCGGQPLAWALEVFVITTSLAAANGALPEADTPRDVAPILRKAIATHQVPGLAAVVLKGNHVVARGVAGVRKSGTTNRLTMDDRFLLCSATKAMTATLVAMAVEEGRLSYETKLGEILSETNRIRWDWHDVTVSQLLEHRAGIPTERSRLWALLRLHFSHRSDSEKRRVAVEKILSHPPKYKPGSKYLYTALDYVVLGKILEETYGCLWEDLVTTKLWQPLEITTGGFGTPGNRGNTNQPYGHWGSAFTGSPIAPGGFWARLSMPLYFAPAGGARMTPTDWARFVSLHLRGDPANPHHEAALLGSHSFATLHHADAGNDYAGGWYVGVRSWAKGSRTEDTGRVIASLGDNGFWHTEAWLAPELDFAVLVVCNQGGTGNKRAARACNDAIGALMKEFLPDQQRDWKNP